ncbi:type I polyketide synthase [Actinomyces vulturis]|uniref:type I polyketide synthase n=1 Tax=Actinomyces vulturis TaxID=1857645 RepID=UPI00082FA72F|nr:type I polyketide synthase [Actinomyces vulturis]
MTSSTPLATLCAQGAPFVLSFAGQATPWRATLSSLLETDQDVAGVLAHYDAACASMLAPVAHELLTITPQGIELLRGSQLVIDSSYGEGVSAFASTPEIVSGEGTDISVPGIVLTQHAILESLSGAGLALYGEEAVARPQAVIGHSQGVLGVALFDALSSGSSRDVITIHSIAHLIGAAATRTTRRLNLVSDGDSSPMLSVRGVSRDLLESVLAQVSASQGREVRIGVCNGADAFIACGYPEDLRMVERSLERLAEKSIAERQAKRRGGSVLTPVTEYLSTTVPFHTDLLRPAVECVVDWAERCGLDTALAGELAQAVLCDPVDWPSVIADAIELDMAHASAGCPLVIDCGPGDVLTRLTQSVCAGTDVAVVSVGSARAIDDVSRPGVAVSAPRRRTAFAPGLTRLPNGKVVVDTAFTRLTGRSAILLAGMTPTTVDPGIVAAAANAGYWAELAGGGQVTAEVLTSNVDRLSDLLEPGRSAAFNAMFMDRYLWNLHLGTQRTLSRARAAGAPIDGICISAGIPERDEARALLRRLHDEGFPYIALKPGTIDQIRQVLAIARDVPELPIIMQVEDGHAGGHHSWEDLDSMLLATYDDIRQVPTVVLCVGGGIGTPERAADYITGSWALAYNTAPMPVDGVLVGTAAMTCAEALTNDDVKQLLVDTPGISPSDPTHPGGWVASGASAGGMTSGLSHLRADLYEIDNASARASRLIQELAGDEELMASRRDDMIEALSHTAKPYFGDVDAMTYAQWARRYAELCWAPASARPAGASAEERWADLAWADRYRDLLQRIEARLNAADHGLIPTLFSELDDVLDADLALERLLETYPEAADVRVSPSDCAWFIDLCRKHPKPVPFVPVVDADILRWWGTDSLWQSQDPRYSADAVRIIPGPVSVAGIDRINEPVGELLGRFESACIEALRNAECPVRDAVSRQGTVAGNPLTSTTDLVRHCPHVLWNGHMTANPAHVLAHECVTIVERTDIAPDAVDVVIELDTHWDDIPGGKNFHAVRELVVPLVLNPARDGGVPVVDPSRLPQTMGDLLKRTAGVGATSITGDVIDHLPVVQPAHPGAVDARGDLASQEFGTVHNTFTLAATLGHDHASVTANVLPQWLTPAQIVPDALLGPAWPVVYAALGSVIEEGMPLIEGLLGAVHLDHTVHVACGDKELRRLASLGQEIRVDGWVHSLEESSAGRVVNVHLQFLTGSEENSRVVALMTERFAIRGRASGSATPSAPVLYGNTGAAVVDAERRTLRQVRVIAPGDMTAFARVTGDFNPIHTSYHAAQVAGMDAPLVHGMWLSATAQQVAACVDAHGQGHTIIGWTYTMHGPVQLNDEVEITVDRVGLVNGGGETLEVTCRINGDIVSRGTATCAPRKTAYLYPGQGIQIQGMGLDERAASPAAKEIWDRADAHTRAELGFSVIALVRDNPTELTARGVTYKHPEGLLNLTQFTQVALATVAMASTARLKERGALVDHAAFAGHSLGEYTALSAYGNIFEVETMLSIVFHRGSTMHTLVPRDCAGHSNYRMGALRPNQCGISANEVEAYVASIAEDSGEFLQIVNHNLAGVQYAIAGTIAGLSALETDAQQKAAAHGGKNPFMLVPGIDVPFHSSVLRPGVSEFRDRLNALVPHTIDVDRLVGKYVPNLVARPFALDREFAQSIVDVVPSEIIRQALNNFDDASANRQAWARTLLIELLAWQFASPVRWIETQDVLISSAPSGLGIEALIEVGLAHSPTLANLAAKTLTLPAYQGRHVTVWNVRRDEARVLATDSDSAVDETLPQSGPRTTPATPESDSTPQSPNGQESTAPALTPPATSESSAAPSDVPSVQVSPGQQTDPAAGSVTFGARDGLTVLLAYAARIRPEQINPTDTTESLTNGVSSRRNQLLMDMGSEFSLASIDGAADSDMTALAQTVAKGASSYRPFGPVLTEALRVTVSRILGPSGVRASHIADRVQNTWGLNDAWVAHVQAAIILGTREGDSMRGDTLSTLGASPRSNAADVDALIDAAVNAVSHDLGIAVALPTAGGEGGGSMVDSAALDAFAAALTGPDGALAKSARTLLSELGLETETDQATGISPEDATALDTLTKEMGPGWVSAVAPAFEAQRAVLIDDRWATVREDCARLALGELSVEEGRQRLNAERLRDGDDSIRQAIAQQAQWWVTKLSDSAEQERRSILEDLTILADTKTLSLEFSGQVAVVTGVAPGSIASSVVARLLEGGATVIATSSRLSQARLDFAKDLYRKHASLDAMLWMVPANLASYRDVDALADWIGHEQSVTAGGKTTVTKPAQVPDLLFPFAAPRVIGRLADAGGDTELQSRVLLWSVERLIGALAPIGMDTHVDHTMHVVLPGSPNRGTFGGDGAYGEVKAALDAVVNKWHVEKTWASRVTFAHPLIGWVRGTGLMGGNDPLVDAVESTGVRTWSTQEIADKLLTLCTAEARQQAENEPLTADFTGGLGEGIDLVAVKEKAARGVVTGEDESNETDASIAALPTPGTPVQPTYAAWGEVTTSLEDMVVIVSTGEVSTWGSGRTRREAELGMTTGDEVELTAAGVLELAWGMGLLTWKDSPKAGWYDQDDELVDEADILERFRDDVVARCGIRTFVDDGLIAPVSDQEASVYLDRDVTFPVQDEAAAQQIVMQDPEHTRLTQDDGGEWLVTRLAGSLVRVPKRAALSRTVGGQFPRDFDPQRWGIPASMTQSLDRIASWNLVTAVDAFLSAGFTPAELLQAVHPSDVASTQGTGFGGMESMRQLFVGRFLGTERPSDILQEALPNVVAAHVMQSYIGGYGSMVQPVSACATAAVSIEEGFDKIALGKAQIVVAGAIDDISIESVVGFGDMNATAEASVMESKGIAPRHYSRANDRRRSGFVEAQGGGTVILARGDVAYEMGLPVAGVLGFVSSYADGAHTSIPAPGLGALAAGRGGSESRLARSLKALGVDADDVAVVSKHDTSTGANDPNESELHTRLARALGRTEGNPLFAVSQKTVTGHAKGGAAVFQVAGLTEILATGVIPGNASLDCVDEVFRDHPFWVWPRRPLAIGASAVSIEGGNSAPVRCGLLTSLGFGHVSGLIAIVHPAAFESAIRSQYCDEAAQQWIDRANERLAAGARQRQFGMMGKQSLFEPVVARRLGEVGPDRDPHEVEAAMLLNPDARLGVDGVYNA